MKKLINELVTAFNLHLHNIRGIQTNFAVENIGGKDHIVIAFDKEMNKEQCINSLKNIGIEIIKLFYEIQSEENPKILPLNCHIDYFPFNCNQVSIYGNHGPALKFNVPITEEVLHNIQFCIASSLENDARLEHGSIGNNLPPINTYIVLSQVQSHRYITGYCFNDQQSAEEFKERFFAATRRFYELPEDSIELQNNHVYLKRDIFNDLNFISASIKYIVDCEVKDILDTWFEKKHKLMITLDHVLSNCINAQIDGYDLTSYADTDSKDILIPMVWDTYGKIRYMNFNEVKNVNDRCSHYPLLNEIEKHISGYLPLYVQEEGHNKGIYVIDLSNLDVRRQLCMLPFEHSVINKENKLQIVSKSQTVPDLPLLKLSNEINSKINPTKSRDGSYSGSAVGCNVRDLEKLSISDSINIRKESVERAQSSQGMQSCVKRPYSLCLGQSGRYPLMELNSLPGVEYIRSAYSFVVKSLSNQSPSKKSDNVQATQDSDTDIPFHCKIPDLLEDQLTKGPDSGISNCTTLCDSGSDHNLSRITYTSHSTNVDNIETNNNRTVNQEYKEKIGSRLPLPSTQFDLEEVKTIKQDRGGPGHLSK